MLLRLRTVWPIPTGIARTSAVALLALVMLAGLIPSGALSALHSCKMACCAAKPSHEAGACNAILPNAAAEVAAPEVDTDEHALHHEGTEMSVTVDETVNETGASSNHCHTAEHSSSQHQETRRAQARQPSVATHAVNTPCSVECAAAVLSLMQLRRPREAAAHSIADSPRPPTLISRASFINSLLPSSTERRRQSRPRAPPVPLVHLSA